MTTPEGRIKLAIDHILKNYSQQGWWFKPVQSGYGAKTVDYLGCLNGRFFAIEAKAPGEQPTKFQRLSMLNMLRAGATVFIISKPDGLAALKRWLDDQ